MRLFRYNGISGYYLCDYDIAQEYEREGRGYNPAVVAVYCFETKEEREEFCQNPPEGVEIVEFYTL